MSSAPKACVFGLAGPELSATERDFFAEADPLGFILFARNVETPAQASALVRDLRAAVGRANAPVLIDQEGGRVARLKPPHWHELPPAAAIGALPGEAAVRAAWLAGRLIAHDCRTIGVSVACAPVLDVLAPDVATEVIGDRAFGQSPAQVAALGRAVADGLMAGAVLPVAKHIPGHGRAQVDSHHALPVVAASLQELELTDFQPFRALSDLPLGMTAHIDYEALDQGEPATCSPSVIERVVREAIGFDGFLLSDDLGMKALAGSFAERTERSLYAGCDAVLHCSGDLAEMQAVAAVCPALSDASLGRWRRALAAQSRAPEPFDAKAGVAALAELMAETSAD